jgi:hypothetical protein
LKTFDPGQRARRLGTALLLLLLPVLPAQARGRSEAWANTQFSTAERMRETLNTLPATERSRHEYQRVINAYRRVYYGAPASAKADPSVVAVADLAEMGRCFERSAFGHRAIQVSPARISRSRRFDALFKLHQFTRMTFINRHGPGHSKNFSGAILTTIWRMRPEARLPAGAAEAARTQNR